MQKENLNYKRLKAIAIPLVITFVLLISMQWIIREVFGPKQRTVKIPVDHHRTLVGKETFKADMADIFYDVDFRLEQKGSKAIELGYASFKNNDWDKHIQPRTSGNWLIIPVRYGNYSKLFLANPLNGECRDTLFSPLLLQEDSLWDINHDDVPDWVYEGSSQVDSINSNHIFVSYEYRVGINLPFQFFEQTIEYEMDSATATITTVRLFDRTALQTDSL